jgi:hypothetical protein
LTDLIEHVREILEPFSLQATVRDSLIECCVAVFVPGMGLGGPG